MKNGMIRALEKMRILSKCVWMIGENCGIIP